MSDDLGSEPMRADDLEWRLVDGYLAGELTGDDAAYVDRWLDAHPAQRMELEQIRHRITVPHRAPQIDSTAMMARLWHRLQEPRAAARAQRGVLYPEQGVSRSRTLWVALAGMAVAAAALILWTGRGAYSRSHAATSVATYVTGRGERANITLYDGTTVALNVASRLEVPADYPAGNHTLHLSGEALFSVLHHAGRPVTVIAGGAAARVLGTSFVVRHYAADTTTVVAVRDGKVAVRSSVLTASQQAVIGEGGAVRVQRADPSLFGFATGVLTFNGMPVPEAILELDRWYDADIRLGDSSLATRRVAGEYAAGSLADLTAYLEMMFNVRVVRHGRVLTLYQR